MWLRSANDILIKYKCLSFSKNYSNKIGEELKKNHWVRSLIDINNDVLLLRKFVYSFEYMYEWEKFNEKSLPEKDDLCINLKMESITDSWKKNL